MQGKNRTHTSRLLLVFRFLRLFLSGHQAVAIENAALRMQIRAFQRKKKRPLLTTFDRVFWITLRSLWSDWRHPLMYVQPDTVVRWQRERFRRFWARLSKPRRRGRGRPRLVKILITNRTNRSRTSGTVPALFGRVDTGTLHSQPLRIFLLYQNDRLRHNEAAVDRAAGTNRAKRFRYSACPGRLFRRRKNVFARRWRAPRIMAS
jgi:hypothetical protein